MPPVPLTSAQITVQGTTLTINGRHSLSSLALTNNATVTHAPAFFFDYSGGAGTDIVSGLHLVVAGNVNVQSGAIDVSDKGHPSDAGPGAGAPGTAGSVSGGGGSYGGSGENASSGAPSGLTYGSFVQPGEFGSGGGSTYSTGTPGPGGAGGGAVRLDVGGTLTVTGRIRANGAPPSFFASGGGAGGSVRIIANTLTGSGDIEADGSPNTNSGGSGGGGRIAMQYVHSTHTGSILAQGGAGSGVGTLYRAPVGGTPALWFDNGGVAGSISRLDSPVTLTGDLVVRGAAVLSHRESAAAGLSVSVNGAMTVDTGASVDVSGKGHPGGMGLGAGGNGTSTSIQGAGASYGGSGENGASGRPSGPTHGVFAQPTGLGSGGGSFYNSGAPLAGGPGGGRIRLVVSGTLTINGTLRANGAASGSTSGGSGSGGSIWVTAGALTGAGEIEADGHSNSSGGASGGGGRISLEYTTSSHTGIVLAQSGSGGGAGTVYRAAGVSTPTLYFDNGGASGSVNRLDTPLAVNGNLVIRGSAIVSHREGAAAGLALSASGDILIETGAFIDASGKGHPAGQGLGAGAHGTAQSSDGAGGSYGGSGADGSNTILSGPTHGSFTQPTELGSGGGSFYNAGAPIAGGPGGGRVRLTAGQAVTILGGIRANGQSSASNASGAGSGGSIWITAATLAGSGDIQAHGGDSGWFNDGGGGRIALEYTTSSYTGRVLALAASGGGPGTVYLAPAGVTPTLYFDSGGNICISRLSEDLTVNGNMVVRGAALICHRAGNPNGLRISVSDDLTVESASYISATAGGYTSGEGPGAGTNGSASRPSGAGAGHAGRGEGSSSGNVGGNSYGSPFRPDLLGSGGGGFYTPSFLHPGGPGGGALRISVGHGFVVNGLVYANGDLPSSPSAGGGSGGSIWITTDTLSGSGEIQARGASVFGPGGSGAGGRIAIYSCNLQLPTGNISVVGGVGAEPGSLHLATATATVEPPVACVESTAVLRVTAPGSLAQVQWRREGVPLTDGPTSGGSVIAGSSTPTLTIQAVGPGDAGSYDAFIAGACGGVASNAAELVVDCCPDINADGNVDQDDVICIINAVAGNPGCTDRDPDFNRDGNVDQDDVIAMINVVAGGPCP